MAASSLLDLGRRAALELLNGSKLYVLQIDIPVHGRTYKRRLATFIKYGLSITKNNHSGDFREINELWQAIDAFIFDEKSEGFLNLLVLSGVPLGDQMVNLSDFDTPMLIIGASVIEFAGNGQKEQPQRKKRRGSNETRSSQSLDLYVRWCWVIEGGQEDDKDTINLFFLYTVADALLKITTDDEFKVPLIFWWPNDSGFWNPSISEWLHSWDDEKQWSFRCRNGRMRSVMHLDTEFFVTDHSPLPDTPEWCTCGSKCRSSSKENAWITPESIKKEKKYFIEHLFFPSVLEYSLTAISLLAEGTRKSLLNNKIVEFFSRVERLSQRSSLAPTYPCLELDLLNCELDIEQRQLTMSLFIHQPVNVSAFEIPSARLKQRIVSGKGCLSFQDLTVEGGTFRFRSTERPNIFCCSRRVDIKSALDDESYRIFVNKNRFYFYSMMFMISLF